jgi:putative nucleotidyltransferase with HDIG domain
MTQFSRSSPAVRPANAKASDVSLESLVASLKYWLRADFSVLDPNDGRMVCIGEPSPPGDLSAWSEICKEVIRRGQPECIADAEPVIVLALPLTRAGAASIDRDLVAIAPFLVRSCEAPSAARALVSLGYSAEQAAAWSKNRRVWDAEVLMEFARMATTQLSSVARVSTLEREVNALSGNLSSTYEEISLLYRLTQNLRLSGSNENLGRLAMQWLSETVAACGFALELLPKESSRDDATANGQASVFLTHGDCPVSQTEFARLIDLLGLVEQPRPLVINPDRRQDLRWPMPAVRQAVVVPMLDGDRLFGWLAAFNHREGHEFGSGEVNLFSSVAAILGIHAANVELYRKQGEFLAGVIRALTSAIDAKDPYTCGHSDRVARVAVRLAKELGCSQRELEVIYLSGLLHDIGKIGIDDHVLRKPGKLTQAEYEHIKLHAEIGYRILKDIKQLDQVLPVVRHHHEAWNGDGYPFGLAGDEIPLYARIVAVADAFDAMSSDRPYRKGMPDEQLDRILREGAGKQWDAAVIEKFFAVREEIRRIMQSEREPLAIDVVHDVVLPAQEPAFSAAQMPVLLEGF